MQPKTTHIILLPITRTEIVNNIGQLQKNICRSADEESQDYFKEWITDLNKLHISLAMFHIGDNQLDRAKAAFNEFWEESKDKLRLSVDTKEIEVKGVDYFTSAGNVLYAKIEDSEWIKEMAKILRKNLKKYDFDVDVRRDFEPHVTICHIDKEFQEKISYPQEVWIAYESEEFGIQQFRTVLFLKKINPNNPGENEEIDSRTL